MAVGTRPEFNYPLAARVVPPTFAPLWMAAFPQLSRPATRPPRSLKGHKGRFRSPGLSASYGFSKETFAVGRGKKEEAPIPAARANTIGRLKSTHSGPPAAPEAT